MDNLILYFAFSLFNFLCAVVAFYKNGKLTLADFIIALLIIVTSIAGTIGIIIAAIVYAILEGRNIIIWKREEVEK